MTMTAPSAGRAGAVDQNTARPLASRFPSAYNPTIDGSFVLPAPQLALWPELSQIPAPFILYGGTAVALQLGHRFSVDFHFFAFEGFDPKALYETVPCLAGSQVIQLEANTLTCIVHRGGDISLLHHSSPTMSFASSL